MPPSWRERPSRLRQSPLWFRDFALAEPRIRTISVRDGVVPKKPAGDPGLFKGTAGTGGAWPRGSSGAVRQIGAFETHHEQDHRHRPRNDQFLRRDHGRQDAQGDRERRGRSDHPLGRRLPRGRRAPRWPACQAPGRDQPLQHPLRHQASDRTELQRSAGGEGQGHGALRHRQGPDRRRLGQGPGQGLFPAAGLGLHPPEDEGSRRTAPR